MLLLLLLLRRQRKGRKPSGASTPTSVSLCSPPPHAWCPCDAPHRQPPHHLQLEAGGIVRLLDTAPHSEGRDPASLEQHKAPASIQVLAVMARNTAERSCIAHLVLPCCSYLSAQACPASAGPYIGYPAHHVGANLEHLKELREGNRLGKV